MIPNASTSAVLANMKTNTDIAIGATPAATTVTDPLRKIVFLVDSTITFLIINALKMSVLMPHTSLIMRRENAIAASLVALVALRLNSVGSASLDSDSTVAGVIKSALATLSCLQFASPI